MIGIRVRSGRQDVLTAHAILKLHASRSRPNSSSNETKENDAKGAPQLNSSRKLIPAGTYTKTVYAPRWLTPS